MPYTYEPRKGYHITKKEAAVVGQALEAVVQRQGEGFSVDSFAAYCQRARGPIHQIWDAKRQQIVGKAGHEAARYLMNGVQRIILRTEKSSPGVARPFVLLPQPGKISGDGEERVFSSEVVSDDVDLLKQAEDKMLHQIRGEIDRFAALAGPRRAVRAVERLLTEY